MNFGRDRTWPVTQQASKETSHGPRHTIGMHFLLPVPAGVAAQVFKTIDLNAARKLDALIGIECPDEGPF